MDNTQSYQLLQRVHHTTSKPTTKQCAHPVGAGEGDFFAPKI